ncbi:MAG: helix-turn-helix domain-containing protein [Coleofasciculus sp. Co-bin14]|nr:helix-turn-helix domain-containing protein [Coleofasciculus sp. Co-bin14]
MNHLTPTQAEQLKEIGIKLRQLRQEHSISTEEIAAKTHIQLRLLQALEEGESDQLPEPIFIQGFIRRYAEALNLDGSTLAQTFPVNELPINDKTSSQEVAQLAFTTFQPCILYISTFLVLSIASGLLYLLNRPYRVQPELQTTNFPQPSVSPTPQAYQSNLPIQVTVTFNDESWLRVTEDGQIQFEGILTKGTQKTWTAQKQLIIRAGNSGAVLLSFNGQEPKTLGNPKEVKEVTFALDD